MGVRRSQVTFSERETAVLAADEHAYFKVRAKHRSTPARADYGCFRLRFVSNACVCRPAPACQTVSKSGGRRTTNREA